MGDGATGELTDSDADDSDVDIVNGCDAEPLESMGDVAGATAALTPLTATAGLMKAPVPTGKMARFAPMDEVTADFAAMAVDVREYVATACARSVSVTSTPFSSVNFCRVNG